jgi:hypothetical protein
MENVTSKATSVAIEYHPGMRAGWILAVAIALIGLVDAILSGILAIAGLDILLIPASAWIATSITLIAILYGPVRWADQT